MKKRFLIIAALIGLLAVCRDPGDNIQNNGNNTPAEERTAIVFDNTQGICTAVVYDDYRRRDEDKKAEVPAGANSQEIEWTPGASVPFYFSYRINIKGISGFTMNYVPEVGKDQTAVPIAANTKTNIVIPRLEETLSSPDAPLSNNSYLLIQNNSSFSFQLLRGDSLIRPDNVDNSVVTSGERAQYTINPGAASNYRLLVGADYVTFSGSLVSFEAGCVYSFVFNNGNISLVSEVEIKLENVAGVSPNKPVPIAPGAPVVTAFDSILTVRWAAVEGAESYEVYTGAEQEPPALPERTVYSTTTVFSNLTNKTPYYVWVKAVNENGASDFSPHARGIPWPVNEVPATPERPVIIPGVNQLTVNWEETGGASSYEVYINTALSTPSSATSATEKTSAVINNLENGGDYYIWIRAVNSRGKSGYSPVESGTPRIPTVSPTAPSRPVLVARNKELAVSWQAVELAASYEVWFGTSDNSAQAQKFGGDITGGITETIVTGLTNETTYHVWIKAKNIIGTSGFSLSANARPSAFAVLPETPDLPTVISGNRELTVSWSSIEGALSYEVWAGATNNAAYAEKYGADVSGTSVTLTGLNNGTIYYIWIKAKNNIGVSGFSPRASGTPSASAATPPAPQAPTVTAGSGQLSISWQAVEGATFYEVWTGTTSNASISTKQGGDVSTLSAVITGLANGTTYYVWLKAKNNAGTSGFSPVSSGTPLSFSVTPQAPSTPAVSIGNGQITVSWTAVEGATAYEIWTGTTNSSASATKNGDDESVSLSRTISGLTNGTTYYVWIKAKNSVGTSGFSPTASGKPISSATVPTLISSNGQLSVSWTAIAGADQYEVFYGTGVNPPQTASQTVNATSAVITGLTNGTIYNVWVRGKNATGNGAMSLPASAKPIGNMGTITLVSGNGQLSFSWNSVAGADEYEVYQNTANSIPANPAQTVTVTSATISGLTNGTTYYVWVKPKNSNGTGGTSTVVSGRPLGTPGAPTLSPSYKQLLVTWTAVAGADEYEVYYGTVTPTTLVTTTTGTTATITGLTNGTTYYVSLRAKNPNGISDYGTTANNVPGLTPGLYRDTEKIGNQNLGSSLSYISDNSVTGDNFYIVLGSDESISPMTLDYSGKSVDITLLGVGGERIITLNANGSMFTVNTGVTLTLDENITLVGRNANTAALVYISSADLIINAGAKISGNTNTTSSGGGIYATGPNSRRPTVTMNGGTISGNTGSFGGGVSITGTFTINGGTISGNMATNDGGGVYVSSGTSFNMNNGRISENTASRNGGGLYLINGTFTMYGGTIRGNTSNSTTVTGGGGGICASNNTGTTSIAIYGGIISGNSSSRYGGGINVGSGVNFTMHGGIIYGSEAGRSDADGGRLRNFASQNGHAVSRFSGSANQMNLGRNTTAGQTDQINTETGRGLSANGNAPFGQ
jgi:fibronectin type 3 domain-containing protein